MYDQFNDPEYWRQQAADWEQKATDFECRLKEIGECLEQCEDDRDNGTTKADAYDNVLQSLLGDEYVRDAYAKRAQRRAVPTPIPLPEAP